MRWLLRTAPLVVCWACAAPAPTAPETTPSELSVQVAAPPPEPEPPMDPVAPEPSCPGETSTRSAALRALACRFRNCYQNSLKSDPELHGKVKLKLRLAPDGSVVDVQTSGDRSLEPLWPCLRYQVQRFRFPPLEALDDDDIVIPLTFVAAP